MEHNLLTIPQRDSSSSLLQLLSNTLVLYETVPYLPVSSLLALGATSKSFQDLVHHTRRIFRYLDLSEVKSARSAFGSIDRGGQVWRNVQLDENVTEDDFYGGPLRGIFHNLLRRNILQDVQTLILDGLAVPADLVTEIITHESFNVRILSIREVQHLNERKLQQALMYAIRPSRQSNTPRLQGLYLFGSKDSSKLPRPQCHDQQIVASQKENEKWFERTGKLFTRIISPEWAEVIQACQGIISFDAVLCAGPRHSDVTASDEAERPFFHLSPRVATYALGGCSGCGRAPEGLSRLGHSHTDRFPLLSPPLLHSSTIKAAKTPSQIASCEKQLLVRCWDCLRTRFCECCHKWWCEDCYDVSNNGYNSSQTSYLGSESAESSKNVKPGVIRSCFECGFICATCVEKSQLMCKVCRGGYCLTHNEGSTLKTCDWCARSGRRTHMRELY